MDPFCISIPNFVKMGKPLRRYHRDFCDFQDGVCRLLDFQKFKILTIHPVRRLVKFNQDRSNGRRYMVI